jgi:cytochrome c biogenesis protein CcmG/thiol:disulfide interchange protein DsbE|tara:strand:- start:64 stop:582 length:519 start_codon:yes stop_codon:yes gene_type:complete
MKDKIFLIILILIFSTVFFIFYKGLQNSNIYTPKVEYKKNIPIFDAQIFDKKNIINSNQIFNRDKFYLLNIWASWCVPCRDEHPYLLDLSIKSNIEIIGLNYKDDKENAKLFLKELDNPYKIIIADNDGLIAIEWAAYGVPESFLIYNNEIIKKVIGPINEITIKEIKELIK